MYFKLKFYSNKLFIMSHYTFSSFIPKLKTILSKTTVNSLLKQELDDKPMLPVVEARVPQPWNNLKRIQQNTPSINLLQNKQPIIPMTKPLTIVVEGNIGSGKTTFLKHFKKFQQVCVLDEPVDTWRNVQGHNLLDLMYKDPHKWSLCFQSYVQLTMLNLHTKKVAQPVKLMERSIFSAKYCFVNNLQEQGLLADAEHTVLSEWFNFIKDNIPLKVDLIVYLRTDPEVVFDRICKRGRSEENAISLEYLKSIHNLHEDWLHHKKFFVPAPVLTFDANDDLTEMARTYSACEDTFFKKISVAN